MKNVYLVVMVSAIDDIREHFKNDIYHSTYVDNNIAFGLVADAAHTSRVYSETVPQQISATASNSRDAFKRLFLPHDRRSECVPAMVLCVPLSTHSRPPPVVYVCANLYLSSVQHAVTCIATESRIDVFSLVVWQGRIKLNEDLHMCRMWITAFFTSDVSLLKTHIVLLRKSLLVPKITEN